MRNVPTMLPIAATAESLPTTDPVESRSVIASFAAYGGTVPSRTLGGAKRMTLPSSDVTRRS